MTSHGLKPHNDDHIAEAKQIISTMAAHDKGGAKAAGGKSGGKK